MSACVNGWNSRSDCSRVMPTPVSRTENSACISRRPLEDLGCDVNFSLLGELDRVVHQVREDLAEADRVA